MSDDEYRAFQSYLMEHPTSGKVIKGGSGLRKIRWKLPGRGKSGGVRIIYYWAVKKSILLMLYMFPKNVQENLSADQLSILSGIVKRDYP